MPASGSLLDRIIPHLVLAGKALEEHVSDAIAACHATALASPLWWTYSVSLMSPVRYTAAGICRSSDACSSL